MTDLASAHGAVAVVDAYSSGALLSRRLAERGVPLVHVRSADHLPDYYLASYRPGDFVREHLATSEPDLVQALRAAGVTAVVPGTESGVSLADALAVALDVPANGPRRRAARRDKRLMYEAVAEAGLAVPLTWAGDDPGDAAAWFASSGLTGAVVKPTASAGSDGVTFCRTASEVRAAARNAVGRPSLFGDTNDQVLVQEWLSGREHYLNTVSQDGRHHLAEVWQYTKTESRAGTPVYDYEEPVAPGQESPGLVPYVFAVLDALEVREGAAHVEVMVTDRGPVLIEVGSRLGGAVDPTVLEDLGAVTHLGLLVERLVGGIAQRPADCRSALPACVRYVSLVSPQKGTSSERWGQRLPELGTLRSLRCSLRSGQPVAETIDLVTSPGFLYLVSASLPDVVADYDVLRAWERAGLYLATGPDTHLDPGHDMHSGADQDRHTDKDQELSGVR